MTTLPPIRIAARTSPLARAQVELVGAALEALGARWSFVAVTTVGDVDRRELTEIGGTGVFVTGVRQVLLDDGADVAVHSLKDLPTLPDFRLDLVAVPKRADTSEVLVGRTLAQLSDGDRIGTGSPRRADQIRDWGRRAGVALEVLPVRGNVGTRLRLVADGHLEGVLLAAAGLGRLGLLPDRVGPVHTDEVPLRVAGLVAQLLGPDVIVPAPGQGALALECRAPVDSQIGSILTKINDRVTRAEVLAERSFLRALQAGCTAPVGARATVGPVQPDGTDLAVDVVVGTTWTGSQPRLAPAGATLLRLQTRGSSSSAEEVGAGLAQQALARLDRAAYEKN